MQCMLSHALANFACTLQAWSTKYGGFYHYKACYPQNRLTFTSPLPDIPAVTRSTFVATCNAIARVASLKGVLPITAKGFAMRLRSTGTSQNRTSSCLRNRRMALALALAGGFLGGAQAQTSLPKLPVPYADAAPTDAAPSDAGLLPYPFGSPQVGPADVSPPPVHPADGRSAGQRLVLLLGLHGSRQADRPVSDQAMECFDSIVMRQTTHDASQPIATSLVVPAAASMPDKLTNSTSDEEKLPSLIDIDMPMTVADAERADASAVDSSLDLQLPDDVLRPALMTEALADSTISPTDREPQIIRSNKSMRLTIEATSLEASSPAAEPLATSPLLTPTLPALVLGSLPSPESLIHTAAPIEPTVADSDATAFSLSDRPQTREATNLNFSDNNDAQLPSGPQPDLKASTLASSTTSSPPRSALHLSSSTASRQQATKLDHPVRGMQVRVQGEPAPVQLLPGATQTSERLLNRTAAEETNVDLQVEFVDENMQHAHLKTARDPSQVVSALELQDEKKSDYGSAMPTQTSTKFQSAVPSVPETAHVVSAPVDKPVLLEVVNPPPSKFAARESERLVSAVEPLSDTRSLRNATNGEALTIEPQGCTIVNVKGPIIEISVEQPTICQLLKTSDQTLSLIGLQPGSTRVAIVTRNTHGNPEIELREVTVESLANIDTGLVEYATVMSQAIARLHPTCNIQVIARDESLIVRGKANSESDAKKILSLVRKTSLTPVVDELQTHRR